MKTNIFTGTTAFFSDHSLTKSYNPDDVIPFIMLCNDHNKALEDYRIAAVKEIVSTCHGNTWNQYIIDRCNNNVYEVTAYTADLVEQEELRRIDKVFKDCNYIKSRIDAYVGKPSDLLQSVLVNYSSSNLLDELQGMYDAEFARHIQFLKKNEHLKSNVGGTRLHDILASYFDKVPGVSTFNKALRGDYQQGEQIRPPKEFTLRVRKDIK